MVLGPDKHLYIISGNFTKVFKDISPESLHKNYAEDQFAPARSNVWLVDLTATASEPPGRFIAASRIAQGKKRKWELFATGMRNTYDFAFNAGESEMFGFDCDMEYDSGMPYSKSADPDLPSRFRGRL